jgi:hypothetical protein
MPPAGRTPGTGGRPPRETRHPHRTLRIRIDLAEQIAMTGVERDRAVAAMAALVANIWMTDTEEHDRDD